jgi:ferredoxin-type protein NapH
LSAAAGGSSTDCGSGPLARVASTAGQHRKEAKMAGLPRYRINTLVRLFFLFLTPAVFRWICPGFVWHSIFLTSVTVVLLFWAGAVLVAPLVGRIPCGWICPFGTVQDLVAPVRVGELRRNHRLRVMRWVTLAAFLVTAFTIGPLYRYGSPIEGWRFAPFRLNAEFTAHEKYIWMYDTLSIMALALFLGRRGPCRFLCIFGAACSVGGRFSRLTPVVTDRCNGCGKCDRTCPARVEIAPPSPSAATGPRRERAVRDPECVLCGLCADICPRQAIRFRFQWRFPAREVTQPRPAVLAVQPRTMQT